MATLPTDLTTLAAVKAWLGLPPAANPTGDPILQTLISQASIAILSNISRRVLPQDYSDRYDGVGWSATRIMLRQWPVLSVSAVSIGNTAITAAPIPGVGSTYGSGYLLSGSDPYPPGSQQYLDFQGYFLPAGAQNIGVSYRAGYATSEAWSIPGSPYAVTLTQAMGAWAQDEGVTISGVVATKVASGPVAGQYSVSTVGVYTFAAADTGKAAVISYGYVPADLALAAMQWIAFQFRGRDFIGYVSKSLASQETVTFSQKDVPAGVAMMLQQYKRVF